MAQQFDLATLTTVHTPEQLQRAAESLDLLLLEPITAKRDELLVAAGRSTRAILLPLADTHTKTLADVERVLEQGNQQLALIDTQERPLAELLRLQQHSRLALLSQLTQADAVLPALGVALKGAGIQGFCLTINEDDNLMPLQQLAQRLYRD